MTLSENTIYWRGDESPGPLFQGRVTRSVFYCNENKRDVIRAEITCEDELYLYCFDLTRGDNGRFQGKCVKFDLKHHTHAGEDAAECLLLNSTDTRALMMSSTPMQVHNRTDLYWLIRMKDVVRKMQS